MEIKNLFNYLIFRTFIYIRIYFAHLIQGLGLHVTY